MKRPRALISPLLFGVALLLAAGSACERSSSPSEAPTLTPSPELQTDYHDSWVENIPASIDGYTVLFVTTPKNRACVVIPSVTLRADAADPDGLLRETDVDSVVDHICSLDGVPDNVQVGFAGGPTATTEHIQSQVDAWNESRAVVGCLEPWGG